MITLCSVESYTKVAKSTAFSFLCESVGEQPGMILQPALAPSEYLRDYQNDRTDMTSEQKSYFLDACRREFRNRDFESTLQAIIEISRTGAQVNLVSSHPVKDSHLLVIAEELRKQGQTFEIV